MKIKKSLTLTFYLTFHLENKQSLTLISVAYPLLISSPVCVFIYI